MNAIPTAVTTRSATPVLLPSLATTVGAYFAARNCFTFLFFQSNPQLGTIVSSALNMLLLLVAAFNSVGPAQAARFSPWRAACFGHRRFPCPSPSPTGVEWLPTSR
jgi:hypothetical protein